MNAIGSLLLLEDHWAEDVSSSGSDLHSQLVFCVRRSLTESAIVALLGEVDDGGRLDCLELGLTVAGGEDELHLLFGVVEVVSDSFGFDWGSGLVVLLLLLDYDDGLLELLLPKLHLRVLMLGSLALSAD